MIRRAVIAAVLAAGFCGTAAGGDAPAAAPSGAKVTFETTLGAITIALDPVGAPKTSAHMLKLFKTKHYVGAAIFRIEKNSLIQLGDLNADLEYRSPPAPHVPLETATNHHARGAVALAHGDEPDSGQSSFYFDLARNSYLDADPKAAPNTTGYAVFAHVVDGMDVLDKISAVELDPKKGPFPGKLPKTPIVVTKVTVQE